MEKTEGPIMTIGQRMVGRGHPCFIVAEVSANHHQKYEEAEALVRAASETGADAVKLQTYTPDTMTIDSPKEWFIVRGKDNPESWRGKTLYDLYKIAYTPWAWQPKLKKLADELEIILFSTPFDETAVDFLGQLHVPCFKIASYEATDVPLLKKVAKTGKPVIISIGFASLEETELAIRTLRENGASDIAVLHCVTVYSGAPRYEDANLHTMGDIRSRFGVVAGFSDNNAGIEVPVLAVAAGASIIEKHLILSRKSGGPDARFSIEPQEFKAMVDEIRKKEKALGRVQYGPVNQAEAYNKRFRRSIFSVQDIKAGEVFTKDNLRVIRPEFGLAPKHFEEVLGRRATQDIERGTPLSWDLIHKS